MVYIYQSKEISLPQWIKFFIDHIEERLRLKEWTPDSGHDTCVCVSNAIMPYSYEGVTAISRHYSNSRWEMKLSKFSTTNMGKPNQRYYYMWHLRKKH